MMWYVYIYFNPLHLVNNQPSPFYVGKGAGNRDLAHALPGNLKNDKNKHKVNTIKKIFSAGEEPIVIRVFETDDEEAALREEIRLITFLGRADLGRGPLTNLTDGGEGQAGKIVSEKTKSLLSLKSAQAHASGKLKTNTLAWQSAGLLKAHSPEGRKKSAEVRKGKKLSLETRTNIATSRKKFASSLTEEERKKHFTTTAGSKASAEERLLISIKVK